jgi:hypothetical protein
MITVHSQTTTAPTCRTCGGLVYIVFRDWPRLRPTPKPATMLRFGHERTVAIPPLRQSGRPFLELKGAAKARDRLPPP